MKTGLKRFLCVQIHFWPFTCVSGGGRGVTLIGNRYVSGDTVTWFLDPGLSALIEITWPLARVVTRGRDSWNGACQQLSQHQGKITSVGQVKHTFKPVQHVKKSAQHFSAVEWKTGRRVDLCRFQWWPTVFSCLPGFYWYPFSAASQLLLSWQHLNLFCGLRTGCRGFGTLQASSPDHIQICANSFYKHPGCSIPGESDLVKWSHFIISEQYFWYTKKSNQIFGVTPGISLFLVAKERQRMLKWLHQRVGAVGHDWLSFSDILRSYSQLGWLLNIPSKHSLFTI